MIGVFKLPLVIFAPNFRTGMTLKTVKSILVAAFSLGIMFFSNVSMGQENHEKKEQKKLDPAKIIMEHVSDGHEFHFASIEHNQITIPLPVILYSPGKGLSVFMSSAFHHGEETHEGYRLLQEAFIEEHQLEKVKDAKGQPLYDAGKIYVVDAAGMPDPNVKIYDFSITRNVTHFSDPPHMDHGSHCRNV